MISISIGDLLSMINFIKTSKEKSEREKPQVLIQFKSESISPVSAKLYLEVENKSSFDIYNINFNKFIKDDFFKLPLVYSNNTLDYLRSLINSSIFLYKDIKYIYELKEKKDKNFLYYEGYLNPYIYLLNIYKDLIYMSYYDTIKYFNKIHDNINKKIESKQEIVDFIGFLQSIDSNLLAINNNIKKYMKEIDKHSFYIANLKVGKKNKIEITDFHFFIFKFHEKKLSEVEFFNEKNINIDYSFEKYENGELIKKEFKDVEIKINPIVIKNNFNEELNEIFNSSYYKDWESSLSERQLRKFKEIKLKAINDIYTYIRVDHMEYLGEDFFTEYQEFIEILDNKFKMKQYIIG